MFLPQTHAFSFYINGGLDKRRLQASHAETLKLMAQVHGNLGDGVSAKNCLVNALEF